MLTDEPDSAAVAASGHDSLLTLPRQQSQILVVRPRPVPLPAGDLPQHSEAHEQVDCLARRRRRQAEQARREWGGDDRVLGQGIQQPDGRDGGPDVPRDLTALAGLSKRGP